MLARGIPAAAVSAAFVLAGCATQPEKIATAYVSPLQYEDYSCKQLSAESQRVTRRASELRGELKQEADADAAQMAIGLVLFWPALFLLDGDGAQATEYGRLKGEKEAIDRASVQSACGLQAQPITPAEPPTAEFPSDTEQALEE